MSSRILSANVGSVLMLSDADQVKRSPSKQCEAHASKLNGLPDKGKFYGTNIGNNEVLGKPKNCFSSMSRFVHSLHATYMTSTRYSVFTYLVR